MNNKLLMVLSTALVTSMLGTSAATAAPMLISPAPAAPAAITMKSVKIYGQPAPESLAERLGAYSKSIVEVTYSNGDVQGFPLTYKTLFKSNETSKGQTPGAVIDAKGNPIQDTTDPAKVSDYISDGPDANTLFYVNGSAPTSTGGNSLNLITHYEYTTLNNKGTSAYGNTPASIGYSNIDQNVNSGELNALSWKKVDMSPAYGVWIPCAGSLSPWNTHLSSEEYEPDARDNESATPKDKSLTSYSNLYFGKDVKPNPYIVGYISEITVDANQKTTAVKHFSMGRKSNELASVMPDNRTVYFGDDGGNTAMFMYIADRPMDLTEGTLYAAKWNQTSDKNGGEATLSWIKLGHANDAEIRDLALSTTFSKIFETASVDTPGFTKIRTYPTAKDEWLKVKTGMEKAAAFLESRRYAAIVGATTEFNKFEGVTFNAKDKKSYIAISAIDKAMLADAAAPKDDIKLPRIKAGAVYELSLNGGQKDNNAQDISSEYVQTDIKAIVLGEDLATADSVGNTAVVNKIANPDNLSYSETLRYLFIGEDSGMHLNNFLWAYNVDTKEMVRILSAPAGGEVTGLQMVDNLNGFSYIMANTQHPGDLAENTTVPSALKLAITSRTDQKGGLIGYLSGMPSQMRLPVADEEIVKLKDILQPLNLKLSFSKKEKQYSLATNGYVVKFKPKSNVIYVDGEKQYLKRSITMNNGSLYVPAQLITKSLHATLVKMNNAIIAVKN